MMQPKISVVLLNCNRNEETLECIRSLKETGNSFEIVVVDNGSSPNPEKLYKDKYPDIIFLRNEENLGTPIGNNVGMRYAMQHGADFVMMLNNDTVVDGGFLKPLVEAMIRDQRIGVAGGKIYYHSEPELIWFAGGRFNRLTGKVEHVGMLKHDHELRSVLADYDFISGCFALFRTSVLNEVGLLDERFFAYMEDVDLNVRIRQAGYRIAYFPEAFIYHKVSTTIRVDSPFYLYFNMRNRLLMLKKHNTAIELLAGIPYLCFYYGRQLIRLAVKRQYWAGIKAVMWGIHDGLTGFAGDYGRGRLPELDR